jgi:hypothetical protein
LATVLLGGWVRPFGAVIWQDLHGDSPTLTWNLWQVTESVLHGRNPYLAGGIYFPVGGNLTTHNYGPGFLPIALLTRAVMQGDPAWPLVAFRATICACFAFGLFAAYHALRALGAGTLPSLAASVAWAFTAFFHGRPFQTHLVALAFLLPVLSLAIIRLVARPGVGRACVAAAVAGASVYFSEYYAAFLWLALLAGVAFAVLRNDTRAAVAAVVRTVGATGVTAAGGVFVLVVAPFFWNWVSSDVATLRQEQAYYESANLAGFVVPDPWTTPLYSSHTVARLNTQVRRGVGGSFVFLGIPVLLFGAVGAFVAERSPRWILVSLAALFLVLSLGPELKILGTNTRIVLPYRALMLVPPFTLARASARLAAIGLWPLVCLQAIGLTRACDLLARRASPIAGTALALVTLGWGLAEAPAGGPAPSPFPVPDELLHLPPGAVLNVPVSSQDSLAMFLQIFHGRPIATGHLSRRSKAQGDHVGRLDVLTWGDPQVFAGEMLRMGIGNVVVTRGAPEEVVARLRSTPLHVVDLRRFY